MRILLCLMLVFTLSGMGEAKEIKRNTSTPAKILFSDVKDPAPMEPRVIGFYSWGCLAGAEALPANGPGWQTMRLSRNRYWGHPDLIAFIKRLAKDAKKKDGWPGLLVGDMSQPRGGPVPKADKKERYKIGRLAHKSHQLGLDVDIWLKPTPKKILTNAEREHVSAVSMIKSHREINPKTWTTKHAKLLRRAALDERVERILINPAIKKQMCEWSEGQKERDVWMHKLRPAKGHHYHFHVRLACPKGDRSCKKQPAPPSGDGCGKALAWWLSDEPYKRKPAKPGYKPKDIMLTDLPNECTFVLNKHDDGKKVEVANKANDKAPTAAGSN